MKFEIIAKSLIYHSAIVDANSFDEARAMYDRMDHKEFTDDVYLDWHLESISCEDTEEIVEYDW